MALVAYTRRRVFWGLVDYESDDDGPTYDSSNTEDGVDNSHNGRRVVIRWTRSGLAEDVMQTHFDLVNITAGNIDDTWTTGDFTAAEAALDTWWTSQKALSPTYYTLAEYRWYRVGPGATPPEPAVRVATRSVAGTVGSAMIAPQVAATVTLKTGLRKHWGRVYLPGPGNAAFVGTTGHLTTSYTDNIATYVHTLIGTLASSDFYLVVFNKARGRMYNVESVQADDIADVIRSRRPRSNIYRKVLP